MNLNTAVAKAFATPAVTFAFIGAPGSGKTSAPLAYARELGKHIVEVSCANLPSEDLAQLPVLSDNKHTMHFAIPDKWLPRHNTVILLDELFKASDDTVNAFLPLVHGKTLFGQKWPDETIVIVTGNSADFKVGDKLQPHSLNRMVVLNIDDWTPSAALDLMLKLKFDARITNWCEKAPQSLTSYDPKAILKPESELDHYWGYDPRFPRRPFCSLRSLHTASHLLSGDNTDTETLSGAIGPKAAASLSMFLRDIGIFINPQAILDGTATVPDGLFDQRNAATTAATILDAANWQQVLTYLKRLQPEAQLVAYRLISRKPTKEMTMVWSKPVFAKWYSSLAA
jgi:hypothetical protein